LIYFFPLARLSISPAIFYSAGTITIELALQFAIFWRDSKNRTKEK